MLAARIRRSRFVRVGGACGGSSGGNRGVAESAGPVESSKDITPTPPPEKPWSFTVTPYGWMSSIQGTIGAGDRSADVNIPVKEVLEHLDMTMMVTAEPSS